MSSYRDFLHRAERHKLSRQELDMVADVLQNDSGNAETYTLLNIIGVYGDKSLRHLVEKFLSYRGDAMLVRLALEILCFYWKDTAQYIDHVRRYIHQQPWDQSNVVRQMAVSAAGEYLREYNDRELIETLISIVERERSEWPGTWEAAYWALLTSIGLDRRSILAEYRRSGRRPPAAHDLIKVAKERLSG